MVDRAVADAAFALKEGETSQPVQGRFGTAIVRVTKIEPETTKSFEEVMPEIKRTIATERARDEIQAKYNKIEDERAGGAQLGAAGRGGGEARPEADRHRGGRPPGPRSRRQRGVAAARHGHPVEHLRLRRRRRERSAAAAGRRLHLVRLAWHHALARPAARGGQ